MQQSKQEANRMVTASKMTRDELRAECRRLAEKTGNCGKKWLARFGAFSDEMTDRELVNAIEELSCQ